MNPLNLQEVGAETKLIKLVILSLVVGFASGVLGMFLALLLHYIQHLAYGYSLDLIITNENFLEGVNASTPTRRVFILIVCGVIAGLGWYLLYTYGKPLVSIAEALKTGKKMPTLSTIIHALLQIVTIALGSPLGREVAPRELGALFATWISKEAGLTVQETKIMIACGAGAGLAAVYNVPLGGAIFTMEVLLCSSNWSLLIPALITSAIATLVSWSGLGIESIYHVDDITLSSSLLVWAVLTSPIFGFLAYWFMRIATRQRKNSFHDRKMIIASLLNYTFIGILAIYFPVLLGNGKSAVQMEFSNFTGIGLSGVILGLRALIVWTCLRVGSQGGLLTPSVANGALLAAFLGGIWNSIWPIEHFSAFIVLGATSFLAAAQKMPITSIILIFEFTHIHFDFLVPIMLAVAGAVLTSHLCERKFD